MANKKYIMIIVLLIIVLLIALWVSLVIPKLIAKIVAIKYANNINKTLYYKDIKYSDENRQWKVYFEDQEKNVFDLGIESKYLPFKVVYDGVYQESLKEQAKQDNIWDTKNVTIKVDEESITKKGATIKIVDKNINPVSWKINFEVQVLVKDKWEYLMQKAQVNWADINYTPDENGETKIYCDWVYLYNELESGTYRIVKDNYPQSLDKIYSEPFIIK